VGVRRQGLVAGGSQPALRPPRTGYPSAVSPLLKSLRPRQWVKNTVVFTGLVFSGRANDMGTLRDAGLAFLLFCAASSSVYLWNDLQDRERDRQHPIKKNRPIASGKLSPQAAGIACLLLAAGSLALAKGPVFPAIAAYLVLHFLYSCWLKHVVLLDVFCIAGGFLLRILAGVWAIEAPLSPWLVACGAELALFFALCKRKNEVLTLGEDGATARPLLTQYAGPGLDLMVGIAASATVVTYALYTLLPGALLQLEIVDSRAGMPGMVWTLPFVLYGILRYLHLVYNDLLGNRPNRALMTDLPTLLSLAGFAGVVAWVVYMP